LDLQKNKLSCELGFPSLSYAQLPHAHMKLLSSCGPTKALDDSSAMHFLARYGDTF
jgi:hypothetical protein